MLSWLVKKGQKSRVYMCIKEVKWETEASPPIRTAMILAISQLFRSQAIADDPIFSAMLDRPLEFDADDLMRFYSNLEDIRNAAIAQYEQTKKGMRRLGMELPTFAIEHAKTSNRGLEIWMATLGAGIAPDRRGDVQEIWNNLTKSFDYLDSAIEKLYEIESRTRKVTGASGSMFESVDVGDWIEECRFIPSIFASRS